MNILSSAYKERPAAFVTSETMHEYAEPIAINPTYKPLLAVMFQASRLKQLKVVIVHNMAPNDAEKHSNKDVGVFEARFEGWQLTLNWTEERRGKLFPDHIAIDFGEASCGIIAPYLTIRNCWNCGMLLRGKRLPGRSQPETVSSHYDPATDLWVSRHCPQCYQSDWRARTIEPSRLFADCAATIADKTRKARLFKSFGGERADDITAIEQGAEHYAAVS